MTSARHCLHVFATFAAGGPQVRLVELLEAFPPSLRHSVVAMDGDVGARARLPPGAPLEVLATPPRGGTLRRTLALRHRIEAARPDLVCTYNWGAIEAIGGARLASVRRLVHVEDGFGADEASRQKTRRVWARRLLLRWVRRVVVPSHNLERIAREVWRVPAGRVHWIPNGIDVERFAPGPAAPGRQALDAAPKQPLVGTVAALRAEKSLDLLLETFAALRPARAARLWIVGDGPERDALERRARALGLEDAVCFRGRCEAPVELLRALDVFVLTSRTEQMPLSVLEAMACALPVVATDVGDVREMVAEPNRPFILPSRDPAALAAALATLLADPSLRRRIGQANRDRCLACYRRETMRERWRVLFEEVLAAP